jgi:hypothetical protein
MKLKVPVAGGVPESTPVLELIESQAGFKLRAQI